MTEAILFKDYVDVGLPEKDTFQLERVERPVAQEGQVLLELVYVSVDPYMRGRMRNQAGYFVGPFQPGSPLTGLAVARVVESKASSLSVGAHVTGFLQWQQLQVAPAEALTPIDEQVLRETRLPLSVYLGALGMTGITAWASLERIGKPKAGETVFVSAAAGAVGLMVGQLCKHVYGCTVVGAAGSDGKIKTLLEYGYDAAFNYKTEKAPDALKRLCPKGIDVYYDNVGGAMLEAALDVCNVHARVVACGSISQYNDAPEDRYGVKNLFLVVTRRIHMQGFIAGDFSDMKTEFFRHMSGYIREGKVKHVEHLVPGGLAQAGTAFNDMMGGANIGKTVVQCAEDPFRQQA